MAYNRITWAADVLRAAGLNVVEEPGWKTRGLSTSQRFEPDSIVWHHDASAIGDSPGVPAYMIANMESHGAQIWVCAGCNGRHVSGTWHMVASGRMAHAGKVLPGKPDNYTSIGIETDQTTGETWEPGLLPSLRKGTAALLRHMKKLATDLHFHKTICDPPGRKVDPAGLVLIDERARVKTEIVKLSTPAPEPITTHTRWATKMTGVHATPGGKKLRDIPRGYRFQVIDGSGHGNDGWIETSAGNWVLGADTTIWDPAKPVRFSIMSWNVENKGDADAALDRAEIIKLVEVEKPTYFCLQEVYRVDLSGIPGYQVYRAWDGYSAESENRAQAILVRNDVALKIQQALAMEEEWVGPKMGIEKDPRVHRYVTGNYHDTNIPAATFHVPFTKDAVEETKLAAIEWLKMMEAAHGCGVIVADWNSLADGLQAKVGDPAGATVDGGGLDKAVYVGMKKVGSKNLGTRGRSDHPVKRWDFEV